MAKTVTCDGPCTITIQVEPAPMTEEQVQDIGLLFGLFLGAAVVIYCAKQLLNIFRVNSDGD